MGRWVSFGYWFGTCKFKLDGFPSSKEVDVNCALVVTCFMLGHTVYELLSILIRYRTTLPSRLQHPQIFLLPSE